MIDDAAITASVFGKPFRFVRGYAAPSTGVDPYSGQLGHSGWDLSAPKGTPVYALASGVVGTAGWADSHGGNTVTISAGDLTEDYAHLADVAVKPGQLVTTGQLIGHVGQTGITTGPHLHLTIKKGGKAVDPTPYLAHVAAGQPARASDAVSTVTPEQAAAAQAAAVRADPTHALAAYGLLAAALLLLGAILIGGL